MSIIRELKKKRMAEINKTVIDESAEDLRYEEVYAVEDIYDVEEFKKDIESIGGEVLENGEELVVRVPHEQKIALESVEEKYFEMVDEASVKKSSKKSIKKADYKRPMAGTDIEDDDDDYVPTVTSKKTSKKLGRIVKRPDGKVIIDGIVKNAKKHKLKNVAEDADRISRIVEVYLTKTTSSWEKDMYSDLTDSKLIGKRDFINLLLRALDEEDFLDMVVDEACGNKADEAFGVATGFENVLTVSGSREELIAIAKKLGIDIKDVKVNKVAEKEFKAGNVAGISEGTHLVALTKDKKNPGNLMLVIDRVEYIPDAEEVNEETGKDEECYEIEIPMEKLVDEDGEKLDTNEILEAVKACKGVNEAEALEDCIRIKYDEEAEDEVFGALEECGVVLDIEDEEKETE